jgi:hypothetical protein
VITLRILKKKVAKDIERPLAKSSFFEKLSKIILAKAQEMPPKEGRAFARELLACAPQSFKHGVRRSRRPITSDYPHNRVTMRDHGHRVQIMLRESARNVVQHGVTISGSKPVLPAALSFEEQRTSVSASLRMTGRQKI